MQLEERIKTLGECIKTLEETVSYLEMLRDIAEEQEEVRMELELDMKEELDMQLSKTREVSINKIYTGPHILNNDSHII